MNQKQQAVIAAAIETILTEIGEEPDREGLQRTPTRVADMFGEIFAGYDMQPQTLLHKSIFTAVDQGMVIIKDITYYSMCEHHLLPFFGRVHVAYLPTEKIIGLSQIPRIVEMYARRMQIQERMTQQIANFLQEVLQPRGVGVIVEGRHLCASMRGIKKEQVQMVTRAMTGLFEQEPATRLEFLNSVTGLGG